MKQKSKRGNLAAQQGKLRQQWLVAGMVLFGGLLVLIGVLLRQSNSAVIEADFANPQLVAMGEDVYNTYCAACHGFNLEGQPSWQEPFADGSFKAPPHDETGHTWHHNDASLVESIKLGGARLEPNIGVSAMPAYDEILTDQQITAVLAYIKSQWPAEILEAQSIR